jgi:hypothetical protein
MAMSEPKADLGIAAYRPLIAGAQFFWRAGAMCAIRRHPDSGLMFAGADPRRPAYALGW